MSDLRQAQLAALTGRPALVVVDVQNSFASAEVQAAVDVIAGLVDAARDSGVPVVWVGLGSDPERPWKTSAWLRQGDPDAPYGPDEPCVLGTPGAEWHRVSPAPGEIIVVKRAYSGFLGTPLEVLLRQEGIGWLAVCGLTTECCVAATATDACQLDWPVLIPHDATAAYEEALHEAALTQLALNVAVLTDAAELTRIWKGASA
ncbi:cysteine hydrolase family protein [Actinoplanes couchii]|uniref:Isochorismatase n=1 Tax=Actinoplanes couchii TaxID=403638 RepID=A0ABQ3X023_9ACTN|nr:isochorismatase family cysteine hydrolase [Actinoplanes couchii]MDR6316123.1 ureidoacrylate peracid hydrolase [Actinoplanes couchii]GID51738.1 isochorismatase [Actinoplanes couchii]